MEASQIVRGDETVLVLDQLRLRRAALDQLLEPWAKSARVTLVDASPQEQGAAGSPSMLLRMVILNLGAVSVSDPQPRQWIRAWRELAPDAPLVVISDIERGEESVNALRYGASGYIPTSIEPTLALEALSFILAGGSFFPPAALLSRYGDASADLGEGPDRRKKSSPLTLRQENVLALLSSGMSNKVIARQLGLRESTVKVHMRSIMRRLGASNRTEAALLKAPTTVPAGVQQRQMAT